MEECKEAGLKARSHKIKCKSQNKWFDQECETEKGNLQSLGEKISKNPYNSELRQPYGATKRRGSNKLVDGRNGNILVKACLISICRTLKRPGDKGKKEKEKEKHMELKQ